MRTRTLIIVLVGLLVIPFAQDTHPAEAKKRFRNVTRTFANSGQIGIPTDGAADPYPVTIQVSGFKKGKIKDVDVTLNGFSHDHPNDVDVLLVGPGGRNTLLMGDAGINEPAANLTLILDDQAEAELPLDSPLEDGTFRPANRGPIDNLLPPAPVTGDIVALTVFNGSNPNGTWRLFIRDDRLVNDGELASGWSLEITAKVKRKRG